MPNKTNTHQYGETSAPYRCIFCAGSNTRLTTHTPICQKASYPKTDSSIAALKLRVSFCAAENEGFVTLGTVNFENDFELQQLWDCIVQTDQGTNRPWMFTMDMLDQDGDILDVQIISDSVAEDLLGEPIEALLKRGRALTSWA